MFVGMIAPRTIKKYFLLLAVATIFVVALLYGVSPHWFAAFFLGVPQLDHNFAHLLRAFMCLYLGFGLFWLFAAFSDKYRNAAVLTTIIFSGWSGSWTDHQPLRGRVASAATAFLFGRRTYPGPHRLLGVSASG